MGFLEGKMVSVQIGDCGYECTITSKHTQMKPFCACDVITGRPLIRFCEDDARQLYHTKEVRGMTLI